VWTCIGDDIVYQIFPRSPRPLADSVVEYAPEAVLTTSTIDLSVNPKFFGKLSAVTKNLSASGRQIDVDFQTDDYIGTSTHFKAGVIGESPKDEIQIGSGNKRKLEVRFRLNTNDATTPPILEQWDLEFFERIPSARYFTLSCEVAPRARVQSGGGRDHTPSELFNALDELAKSAEPLTVESIDPNLHGKVVTIYAQPNSQKIGYDSRSKEWEGYVNVYLKEVL